MKKQYTTVLILFVLFSTQFISGQRSTEEPIDFNRLSEQFLQNIRDGKSTGKIESQLANISIEALEKGLPTTPQKIAFWVNIYNAYIQVILSKNPELYENRREFFGKDQILLAGRKISFAKIEHGIIRKSQWELGLGLIRKWFPDKFERKLRVDVPDYRIHFALNCGATDCPPVAIYEAERLNEQLQKSTEAYLRRTSAYDHNSREVAVTSLFNWFRGDFGCKRGIKEILYELEIIPSKKRVKISYKAYDWTLALNNFTEL